MIRQLTAEQRELLKTPIGKLVEGTPKQVTPKLADYLLDSKRTIAIGDVLTTSLVEHEIRANVYIVDNLNKRHGYEPKLPEHLPQFHICNPPGKLSEEALYKTDILVNAKQDLVILVEGEEDLLTLPAVLYAPLGSKVLYGQPDEGVVIIEVNKSIKSKVEQIILKMEKMPY